MSRPIQPSGMASAATTCVCASAANLSAATASVGSISFSPYPSSSPRAYSTWSSSTRLFPIWPPRALMKVNIIPPPISMRSTLGSRRSITLILSLTFAPPMITT